jgi:Mitochondrial ribosomal protein (VAR1)
MNKNLNQLKWDYKYKGINITINDKKKMVKLFNDKYIQFLSRIKGTSINSKDDLIIVLNRKPRSFLKRLNSLITQFKHYDKQLTKNLSLKIIHPKNIVTVTKKSSKSLNESLTLKPMNKNNNNNKVNANLILEKHSSDVSSNILSNSLMDVSKLNTSKLINPKLNILTNKINTLKKSLNTNELVLPLNLLNPLLKIKNNAKYKLESFNIFKNFNKSNLYNSYISKNSQALIKKDIETTDLNPELYNRLKIFNFWDLLTKTDLNDKISFETYLKINRGMNKSYTNFGIGSKLLEKKIIKLRNLIKNYNDKNINSLTLTKYFQLITSYKSVNAFQQNIQYNFNRHYKYNNIKIQSIFTLLECAFRAMSCFISKPVFMETPDNLIINLFYFFVPGKVKKVNRLKKSYIVTSYKGITIPSNNKFNVKKNKNRNKNKKINPFKYFLNPNNIYKLEILCNILSKIFNKKIQLDLTPLKAPFFDDNILVKAIAILSKRIPVRSIFNLIYRRTILYSKNKADLAYKYSITKSFLAGIKIKIGGRLMTQRVIPKKSSRVFQRGAIAKGKVTYVDWSRVNLKNKRGAHSITVTMSHVI